MALKLIIYLSPSFNVHSLFILPSTLFEIVEGSCVDIIEQK